VDASHAMSKDNKRRLKQVIAQATAAEEAALSP